MYRFDLQRQRLVLTVHVQPNAKLSAVAGHHGDALKIRIAAPAVVGKANTALIDFLHQWFNLPMANITIKRGASSRRKVVEIVNPGAGAITILRNITS
jgi:uncharacterized protein (TIGR00251 family)